MRILVIGNGFDLAHYLPTSYYQFMRVMDAIDNLVDVGNAKIQHRERLGSTTQGKEVQISFHDIFGKLAKEKSEKWFFDNQEKLYDVYLMTFEREAVWTIQKKLKENSWYVYFKNHLTSADASWIDFETHIGEVLEVLTHFMQEFERTRAEYGAEISLKVFPIGNSYKYLKNDNKNSIFLEKKYFDILKVFVIFIEKESTTIHDPITESEIETDEVQARWDEVNPKFISYYEKKVLALNYSEILKTVKRSLDGFLEIFDLYFCSIISKFKPENQVVDLVDLDKYYDAFDGVTYIYSFNYTSTFLEFYPKYSGKVGVSYLHGQAGNADKRLVLGISKLPNEILRNHKAYGFVKYHQKLFNNTDYKFLKENKELRDKLDSASQYFKPERVEIVVWGHSLDISDQEYIKEIFSFNKVTKVGEKKYEPVVVTVTILFHNEASKFSILANLLHILGKKLVERWMKKEWLKFEPVPDIYKLNYQLIGQQINEAVNEFEPNFKMERDQPTA